MYKFQDCEFEIGKPICVLCFGYKTRGRNSEPDSWFPVSSKKDVVGNAALKVKRSWDAVCHPGSYGYKHGLIEVLGSITEKRGCVEGFLAAEDIIKRLENKHDK